MGRTHKQLTPQQVEKLHKANHIGRVKGIHPTGGWLGPSTRATNHIDTDYDSEEEDGQNSDYYVEILKSFYNKHPYGKNPFSGKREFNHSMYEALYEKDYGMVISLIIEFMEEIVETYKTKLDSVDLFGNLEHFDIDRFEIYLEKYFSDVSEEDDYMWMEHYKPNSDEE
jgi:hypothetical protein